MARSLAKTCSPVLLLVLAMGCSVREAACGKTLEKPTTLSETEQAAAKGEELPPVKIAVLGDSITEGFGLLQAEAFPARLQEKFDADGYSRIEVVSAGLSGDTTAGGLRRLEWVLEANVKILVVALGANDALRGQSPAETKANLSQIIEGAHKKGARVLLTGMQAPTNLGEQYQAEFKAIYPELAAKYKVTFLPFLLEGIAGHPELNQEDGIHPTAAAQRMIAEMIYPLLQPLADDMLSR